MIIEKIKFIKIQASGNDFIVVDNRHNIISGKLSEIAVKWCDRKKGIGADGLLLIEKTKLKNVDFKMRIFNSDGSEAEMCGNGARCISWSAYQQKIVPSEMVFEAKAGLITGLVKGNMVEVKLTQPHSLRIDVKLKIDNKTMIVDYINTGVPHTIVLVKNLDKIDVNRTGQQIRRHKEFKPKGTNVDFVQVKNISTIQVRTYERGVEEETLACGTGSVASAIVTGLRKLVKPPVKVLTRGGEMFYVEYILNGGLVSDVYLQGKVEESFCGIIKYDK